MEDENKTQKLSILKPQKTRLPLGELDLGNQDSAEQVPNLNKSTRRVSFASNNFIKPFVADPEKNTIWDLTYEESLEKSDSLQCAKANIDKKNVCESLNVTIMNDYGDEINLPQNERTMRNTSVNVILDQENKTTSDMEFTSVIDNIQNVNVDNNNSNMGLCDMELTNVVHNVQNVNYDGSNITMNLCDMEFTNPVCILNIDVHNEGDNMHISEVSMEETEMVPILIRETTQNILVGTNDMCNLAASSEKSQNISVTTQNDKTSDNNLEVSMDQTEVVPILIDVQHHDISVVSENVLRHSQSLCASYDNKKSDFSKVISGDLNPSFRNLSSMPLRGFNSTSFVESCMKDETLSKCQQNMDENGDDSSVQDANIYMFNNPTENCNTDTPLTDNTSSELKNSGSDTNLKNVGCETTIWNRVKPLDTSWINSYRERNISFKTRHHKYFKLVGHRLQEVSKIYEREIHKCGEIKEILNYLKLHKEKEDKKHNLHQEHGTWKDNILELHLRSKDYWSILSLDDDLLKFSTLYGTITFTIEVSDHDRRVLNLELENLLSEAAEPFALYVNNIFMKKLKLEPIQSALGEKFDILSLLDYVRLTMENLLTIHKDFVYLSITYAVSMDREFNIKFAIIGVNSMFSWRFIINASDYENISQESVTYNAKIGELRERDIKRCMQGCPKGFGFVKPFVENLNNFVEELEKTI